MRRNEKERGVERENLRESKKREGFNP